MHCDLEQELGQVLGGQVDYWPTQFGWRLLTFIAYSNQSLPPQEKLNEKLTPSLYLKSAPCNALSNHSKNSTYTLEDNSICFQEP